MKEIWKDVAEHPGLYQVSDHGQVRVLPHDNRHWRGHLMPQPGRMLAQSAHSGGYRLVTLRGKKHYVHRLVAAAFLGAPPPGQDVNHIDGDKANNRRENLEYCNRLHNVRHAILSGLQDNRGEGNGMNKYRTVDIIRAYSLIKRGRSYAEASQETGVAVSTIQEVMANRRWRHLNLPILSESETA